MSDLADQRFRLAAARADFLDSGSPDLNGVPQHVAASWRRSASSGVVPERMATEHHRELDCGSRLVWCAQPVIEQLADQLADLPMGVALTDDRARILTRRDSSPWIGRILDRVHFAQGFDYAEGAVGTNGVGTVLEFGDSVHIVGAEHFVDSLQSFACAGAPVRDPLTGRIAGVLDISCLSEHSTPIMHSMVRTAAQRIEQNLLLDRNPSQQALFDAYSRVDARSRQAVLAVGPRVVLANAPMQTLLGPHDQEVVQDHLRFLLSRCESVDDRVDLPSGTRIRLRGSAVTCGDQVAGIVTVVTLVREVDGLVERLAVACPDRGRPASGGVERGHGVQVLSSHSPAWRAAAATVESALRTGEPVLVLGEPGCGRVTLLAEKHRLVHDASRVVVLEAEEVEAAPGDAAARLLREETEPVLLVLRNVDRLSRATVEALAPALRTARGALRSLAATASEPTSANTAYSPLMAAFRASATVPALRHRGADLPGLAVALLAELAPHRDVRLSRDAVRLLERYSWPGNVRQLSEALACALTRRPVGCIEAQDLPAFCQSEPRSRLRQVDEIERDAIVRALRGVDGNRVAAAATLGLARSTLYRKIRQYGITV